MFAWCVCNSLTLSPLPPVTSPIRVGKILGKTEQNCLGFLIVLFAKSEIGLRSAAVYVLSQKEVSGHPKASSTAYIGDSALIWKQAHHRVDTESIHSSLSIYSTTIVGKVGAGQFHSNYFLRFVLFHFGPLPTPAHIETFNKCGFSTPPKKPYCEMEREQDRKSVRVCQFCLQL